MNKTSTRFGLSPIAVLCIASSLSIGWGIRGNFGHESGAMIAGVLAAIAVAVFSMREDWRSRVAFFALFGGLGWGFGGSISYMYPISFAGSEQWATSIYGFLATFLVGMLWAGLGGMGCALSAVMDRVRLNAFIRPVFFVLAAMALSNFLIQPWLAERLAIPGADMTDATWNRHHHPLYWFDADWFSACAALVGVCIYDLWNRKGEYASRLLLLGMGGAAAGEALYRLGNAVGFNVWMASFLVVPVGDAATVNPQTGLPFGPGVFLTNWPNFVHYYPQHLGWLLGAGAGIGLYFYLHGKWRHDSRLLLYLSGGWLLAFLMLPTLGSIPFQAVGGLRLTPPRSDDWAGILGVFIAALLYARRHHLRPAAYVGALTGLLGGFAFILAPFLRALLRLPGHPLLTSEPVSPFWQHYQSANWHSIMEQSHGFGHGIALAIAMSLLAARLPLQDDGPSRRRGPEMAALMFVLFIITWLNIYKNVAEWTEGASKAVPAMMKAPLIAWMNLSAGTWFMLVWCAMALAVAWLMRRHWRQPLAVIPASWSGRGQLLYLVFLWVMVIANFERALVSFHESRLATEWMIMIHAILASLLITAFPVPSRELLIPEPDARAFSQKPLWLHLLPLLLAAVVFMAAITRLIYGNAPLESPSNNHKRWGDEAQWRIKPILRGGRHL